MNPSSVRLLNIPRTLILVTLTGTVIVRLSRFTVTLAQPATVLLTIATALPLRVDTGVLMVPSVVLKFRGIPSGRVFPLEGPFPLDVSTPKLL